jgi:tetratricopeptide (TPR) repeat protein
VIAIHFFPRSSLAPFFAGSKRYEEALAAYDHALHLSPQDAQVYANKGISLAELGRYEEAVQVYDEALHLEPNDPDTYEKKGEALLALYPYIPPRRSERGEIILFMQLI